MTNEKKAYVVYGFGLGLIAILLLIAMSGCGAIGDLRWVPPGETPPAGSKSLIEAVNDVSDGAVGGWVQTLAGFAGCGGLVALARKLLKDRAKTRKMREQETAIREIVGGVQELRQPGGTFGETIKETMGKHQQTESTRRIVANVKVDHAKISDKN